MNWRRTAALVTAGVLLVCASPPLTGQALPIPEISDGSRVRREYTAQVRREFNQLMIELGEAWVAGDSRAFAGLYSPAAALLLPGAEIARGREQIVELVESLPGIDDFRSGLIEFTASGSLAFAMGPYWSDPSSSTEVLLPETGRYVAVLEREGNRWRIRSLVLQPDPAPPADES